MQVKPFASLVAAVVFMAALLFVSAGTLDYWQAWLFLGIYMFLSLAMTVYLMKRDPKLLERRMSSGPAAEKEPAQKIIMLWMSLGFIGLLVVPALDRRFGWSRPPPSVALAGEALVLIGWVGFFLVFRANAFASATVELAPDQTVASTGPYAVVRHPMYAAGLVMLAGMSPALGSWWGLMVIVSILPALVWRLLDEERFLAKKLTGYSEYQRTVRYRLLPGVW
jgi:protein-S-isoprenylcysteine O-methyltransferase Ste14